MHAPVCSTHSCISGCMKAPDLLLMIICAVCCSCCKLVISEAFGKHRHWRNIVSHALVHCCNKKCMPQFVPTIHASVKLQISASEQKKTSACLVESSGPGLCNLSNQKEDPPPQQEMKFWEPWFHLQQYCNCFPLLGINNGVVVVIKCGEIVRFESFVYVHISRIPTRVKKWEALIPWKTFMSQKITPHSANLKFLRRFCSGFLRWYKNQKYVDCSRYTVGQYGK